MFERAGNSCVLGKAVQRMFELVPISVQREPGEFCQGPGGPSRNIGQRGVPGVMAPTAPAKAVAISPEHVHETGEHQVAGPPWRMLARVWQVSLASTSASSSGESALTVAHCVPAGLAHHL